GMEFTRFDLVSGAACLRQRTNQHLQSKSKRGSETIALWPAPCSQNLRSSHLSNSMCRLQCERVFAFLRFGSVAERLKNRPAFIPGGKLIGIVAATRLS